MFGFTIDEKLQIHNYGYDDGGLTLMGYSPKYKFSIANILFPAAYAAIQKLDGIHKATDDNQEETYQTQNSEEKLCISQPFGEYCVELLKNNNWKMDYSNAPNLPPQGLLQ